MAKKLLKFFLGFMVLLIFYQGVTLFWVAPKGYSKSYLAKFQNLTAEQLEANRKAYVKDYPRYNLSQLEERSFMKLGANIAEKTIVGAVYIPKTDTLLPITEGTDHASYTATTLKERQRMGEGNYAIGSDSTLNRKLLLTGISDLQVGDKIFMTNKQEIHLYEVTIKEKIRKGRNDYLANIHNKTTATLVTPLKEKDFDGYVVVRATHKNQTGYTNIPEELKSKFGG